MADYLQKIKQLAQSGSSASPTFRLTEASRTGASPISRLRDAGSTSASSTSRLRDAFKTSQTTEQELPGESRGVSELIPKPVKEFAKGFISDPMEALKEQRETTSITAFGVGAAVGMTPGGMGAKGAIKGTKGAAKVAKGLFKVGEEVVTDIGKFKVEKLPKATDKMISLIDTAGRKISMGIDRIKRAVKGTKAIQEPLIQEAKKYKSADEFIKSQEKPLLHFTSDTRAAKIWEEGFQEVSINKPLSITSSKSTAWDLKYKAPVDVYVSPDAKIMKYTDLPKDMRLSLGREYVKRLESGVSNVEGPLNKKLGEYVLSKGYQGIKQNARSSYLDDMPDFQDLLDPYETRFFDSSALKTEPQLTDIYNKSKLIKK